MVGIFCNKETLRLSYLSLVILIDISSVTQH